MSRAKRGETGGSTRSGDALPVYVGPEPDPVVSAAVERSGGVLVPLESAAAAIWTSLDPDTWKAARPHEGVRWVQLLSAGVENWITAGVIEDDRIWTSAQGVSAVTVAEHAVGLLLAMRRRLVECARADHWRPELEGVPLRGSSALIVGCGAIGTALIRMLASFEVEVLAVTRSGRSIPGAAESHPPESLPQLWPRADVVILAAPATPRTRHVIDRGALAALPRHATLVNVARGSLIDTDALVEALRDERIAGAALDVTDPEPLPTGHPLWSMDRALITPHAADPIIAWKPNVATRVAENLRRYRAGADLVGAIDLDRSY